MDVDVELAVRELLADPVRPVQRQSGLADPRRAGDQHDRAVVVRQQGVHVRQLGVPSDQRDGRARELRGDRHRRGFGGGLRGHANRRAFRLGAVPGQHGLVHAAQLGTRFDAQFLDQHAPGFPIGGQRLGLTTRLDQRAHQQPVAAFAQRVLGDHRGQLGHQLRALPDRQPQLGSFLEHGQPAFHETTAFDVAEEARNATQGFRAEQRQGVVELDRGSGEITGRAHAVREQHLTFEHVEVQRAGLDAQQVAVAHGRQQLGRRAAGTGRFEGASQPGDVGLHQVDRTRGHVVAPDGLDDLASADRGVAGEQQHREDGALLRGAKIHLVTCANDPEKAENLEPQGFLAVRHRSVLRLVATWSLKITSVGLQSCCRRHSYA